jgi:uncharacterized protein YecE (DUF72 family)
MNGVHADLRITRTVSPNRAGSSAVRSLNRTRIEKRNPRSLYVGTAGWSIAARYKDTFPASGSQLEQYSQLLNAVEINSSFHRHHRKQTYERWSSSVPQHFRFSVKVPRALTHDGALTLEPEVLEQFLEEVSGLGNKLGALLVQLPPSLAFDARGANRFFRGLRRRIDARFACEPRHPSWGTQRADDLLANCAVTRVAADPPPWPGADEPGGWRGVAYFRWHGQPRKYYSNYDERRLARLRQQLGAAAEQGASELWSIFDNTVLGCALGNALAVRDAIH